MYHFHPPRQDDPLVIYGKQQRAVVFGSSQPGPHVTTDPFAVRHRRPAHRIESIYGYYAVQRFVARGQRPKRQVLFAVRVQKPAQ